jgi:hypothetical protein
VKVHAPGDCATCAPTPAETERLEQIFAQKQRGEHISDEDKHFLDDLSRRSSKGLVTVGAGVAYSLKGAKKLGGANAFSKTALEVTTDQPLKVQQQVGVERSFGTGKIKTYDATNEDGSKHRSTALYEQDVRRIGPVRVLAEGRTSPDQENGALGLKLKVQQEVSVPSLLAPAGVHKAEVEAYAYARVNILNGTEQSALEARMIERADALQQRSEQRRQAFADIPARRQEMQDQAAEAAAKVAWENRVRPPPPPLVPSSSGAPAGGYRVGDAGGVSSDATDASSPPKLDAGTSTDPADGPDAGFGSEDKG